MIQTCFTPSSAAGVQVGPQAPPLRELPPGVTAWHGWANRVVFAASYLWLVITAQVARSIMSRESSAV